MRNFYTSHAVFRSHGDHRGHGGGAEKALTNLCSKLGLSRSPQRPRRGGMQRYKNLCALCASVRNFLYIPYHFQISRRSQRTRRGGRKSVEKPLFETMPLTESTKDKERGAGKDIKTSVPSVPLCETSYTSHAVFRSHGDHRGHGGGAEKALKNLCSKLCLSRRSQRTWRGRQAKI